MNKLFHTAPISLNDWLHIITVGLTIHIIIALDKTIRAWLENRVEKNKVDNMRINNNFYGYHKTF